MKPCSAVVAHHLNLVGLRAVAEDGSAGGVGVWCGSGAPRTGVNVLLASDVSVLPGIEIAPVRGSADLAAVAGMGLSWARLRSFHSAVHFTGEGLTPVVTDPAGRMVWAFQPHPAGGLLLIGTDLAADLTLLRQGRPEAARNRPTDAQWGFAGERPNYLFEQQLDPEAPFDRPADWWLWTLRDALIRHGGVAARPVLPGGAPGMVIVTGDDDQAPIEDYRAQRALLGDLPVTYFLHPLCKLDRAGLAEIGEGRDLEWELHPDALETPEAYPARLAEQCGWFETLTGRKPGLVRNHGFLNDGYWGHARLWLAHGIRGSSNIPGVDGRVVNGSLLPARLALDGALTQHWSVLTAFGDGAVFVHGWDAPTTREAVLSAGRRIAESGVPGVLVFNLHPANHLRAAPMHEAVRRLVEDGFVASTLGDALDWFGGGQWRERPVVAARERADRPAPLRGAEMLRLAASLGTRAVRAMTGRAGRGQ